MPTQRRLTPLRCGALCTMGLGRTATEIFIGGVNTREVRGACAGEGGSRGSPPVTFTLVAATLPVTPQLSSRRASGFVLTGYPDTCLPCRPDKQVVGSRTGAMLRRFGLAVSLRFL
jgi:hypothetical protein